MAEAWRILRAGMKPMFVVWLTGVAAAVIVSALAVAEVLHSRTYAAPDLLTIGSALATFWAFLLALAIYYLTANDTKDLQDQVRDLTAVVAGKMTVSQDALELAQAIEKYREWVDALLREYPSIPLEDIVAVQRADEAVREPGDERGRARNLPIIIETKRGREYSVFKGGRRGGFTVNKIERGD